MPPVRDAFIVASDTYSDPQLRQLRAPGRDAQELADVLRHPDIGDFSVRVSMNQPYYEVRVALEDFLANRSPDDVLLLHFSCHGIKDEAGRLFLACSDTRTDRLNATGISADYVDDLLNRTRSRHVVLLLDCCFSGAFTRGMRSRGAHTLEVSDHFQGRGRAVLTASSALEYAWEGDAITQLQTPSVFTSAVVNGLRSGEADRDRDGNISVDELYDYVFERVRDITPNQTPGKWSNVEGMLVVARSARGATAGTERTDRQPAAILTPPRVARPAAQLRRAHGVPAWGAPALVGGGWALVWVLSLAFATTSYIEDILGGLIVLLGTWVILAVLVGAATRWAAAASGRRGVVAIGVGWPLSIALGVAGPLLLGLGAGGAAVLGLAIAAAGVLAAVALVADGDALPWDRALIAAAAWCAGWLWPGVVVWPAVFWRAANGYSSTLPDLFANAGFVALAAGGILSGLLGGIALYILFVRAQARSSSMSI